MPTIIIVIVIIIIIIIILQSLPHAAVTDPKVTRTSEIKEKREYNTFSIHGEKITKFPQQEILYPDTADCPDSLVWQEQNIKLQIIFNTFKILGKIHNNCTKRNVVYSYSKNCYITVR
jgi:hypothetical protein